MLLTIHAEQRMKERGIAPILVDWLEQYGVTEPQNGSELLYFNHRALKKLASYTGGLSNKFDKLKKVYLVRGNEGAVITIGYREQRVKRK